MKIIDHDQKMAIAEIACRAKLMERTVQFIEPWKTE